MRRMSGKLLRIVSAALVAVPLALAVAAPAHAATPGALTVTVSDYTGAPLVGAEVAISSDGQTWQKVADRGGGTYGLTLVSPNGYKVRIKAPGGLQQYVPGQTDVAAATVYQVVSGQTTTVQDQLLPSGNLQVSLVDTATGAPVTRGCVTLVSLSTSQCDHADGRYLYAGVPVGAVSVNVSNTRTEWPTTAPVTVAAGPNDVLTLRLDPAAAIQTTVQSSADPSVHPSTCVRAVFPGVNDALNLSCSQPDGSLLIGPYPATTLQLFAQPNSTGDYGVQWVGPNGGTGDQRQALKVATTVGTVTAIPPIRLDGAGSITGVVEDDYPYAGVGPHSDIFIQPFGSQDGLRLGWTYGPALTEAIQSFQTYTLTGLGPYAWPVEYFAPNGVFADQWSGGAPDRYSATPIAVQAGRTVRNDVMMSYHATGGVTGTVALATGATPATTYYVRASNAVTGDDLLAWYGQAGQNNFGIGGLNDDPVQLTVSVGGLTCHTQNRIPTSGPQSTGIALTVASPTNCGQLAPPRAVPQALTSGPSAVANTSARRVDVFASAGGSLALRSWTAGGGWSDWTNLGGSIAGTPAAFYNPRFGTTEVYARTTANHLAYRYWAGGWSDWFDLGGNIQGDPAVMYNPRFGTTEVYVRTAANHLAYRYWSNGWSDWFDLGGDIAANPSLMFNPKFGTTEAYVRTAANHLAYRYWSNGWSDWIDLAGDVAGAPSARFNPNYGTTEVYLRTSAGHVAYRYWLGGWSGWIDLNGAADGDPAVLLNPNAKTTELYVRSGGQVMQKVWTNQWWDWSSMGGNPGPGVAVVYDPTTTNTDVLLTSPEGYLYDKHYDAKNYRWSGWLNLRP